MNGIIVTDNDGDVGNESWQQNWQSDCRDDDEQGNRPASKVESFIAFELTGGALRCIGCLMTLKRGFKSEFLAFRPILNGLRPDDSNSEVGIRNAEVNGRWIWDCGVLKLSV